jgi:hypothetical protein
MTGAGRALILEFEVGGGEAYYSRYLSRPTWPGQASGLTIGIGYDLGYNSAAQIRRDWAALSSAVLLRLGGAAGVKGRAARELVARFRDVRIPWRTALDVFESLTVPRFELLRDRAFPGNERLPAEARDALLSLIFNRGTSMRGSSRAEMREIAEVLDGLAQGMTGEEAALHAIAGEIRAMTRIWAGTEIEGGMKRRREAEARLIESCAR